MADRAEYLATARGESLTRQQAVESGLREFAETRKKQGAPGFDDVDTWVTENLRRAVLEDGRLRKARSEAMESWLRAHLTS